MNTGSHFVWDFDPVFFTVFGVDIRYYSVLLALGFNIDVFAMYFFLCREKKIKEDDINILLIYCFIAIAVGLRLFEALFYSPELLQSNFFEIFLPIEVTDAGISFRPFRGLSGHGAILGIIIVLFIFCRKKGISFLALCDYITPYVCIAGALVRIGNFCNSEILGKETDSFLGIVFVRSKDVLLRHVPRYPVQLFESASYFFIAFLHFVVLKFLVAGREDKFRSGFTASLTIILVYVARVLLEVIKSPLSEDDRSLLMKFGFKYGQLLSFGFIIVFSIVLLYRSPLYFILKKKEIS